MPDITLVPIASGALLPHFRDLPALRASGTTHPTIPRIHGLAQEPARAALGQQRHVPAGPVADRLTGG
ncbi:hypothetical protein Acor_75930 [Acrocarpospora corrugata]|uniref:Uncharacterized protein n=1 Tax=Acrocarpospora corrugata TaxID=35763 RepID=A0A5M3W8X5_9ACTN|nr:hypothetical protein Acor_75930 [Acrocarpospora corrugata]